MAVFGAVLGWEMSIFPKNWGRLPPNFRQHWRQPQGQFARMATENYIKTWDFASDWRQKKKLLRSF
jgi:hypothetical protein